MPQIPDRWFLIAVLAILVGLGIYVVWPRSERVITADSTPVSLPKRTVKTLLKEASASKQQADENIIRTAPIHAQAQAQHFSTHHFKPSHALPLAADSVRALRDSLQRTLTTF